MYLRAGLTMFLLCTSALAQAVPPPAAPAAKQVPFTETVQGIKVSDPYRWMETADPDYGPWLKAQAERADIWLKALPRRDALLKTIGDRSGAVESVGAIQQRGSHIFLQRRAVGAQTSRLAMRDTADGAEVVLFDPVTLDTATAKGNAINYWEAAPDGRHIYLGVSPGGSEESTLHVLDVETRRFVDGEVRQALFNSDTGSGGIYPQWLPDGSGFFYNVLAPGAKADSPDYYLNTRLFFHKLGTAFSDDRLIVKRGLAGAPEMTEVEAPILSIQPGSRMAMLLLADGVERNMRLLVAPVADVVAGTPHWQPIGSRADRIVGATFAGDDLYMLRADRNRGRVVKLPAGTTDLGQAVEVVPEGPNTLDAIFATDDGLYLAGRGTAGATLRLLDRAGQIRAIAMPFPGASYLFDGIGGRKGFYVSLENYVTPRKRFLVQDGRLTDTGLGPLPPYDTSDYVMDSVEVTARDGTRVPLDIVYRRGVAKDGRRPVLLEAYGAYGINVDPFFNPRLYGLLDAGAIYAVAHVRGGGELGRDWWRAGFQATKSNTWHDAIDCALWLNASGWTSGKRITLWGTSAGGIMVGRGITERPELWAGGISSVGIANAMRFEFAPNGKTNIAEFGTVATPDGAQALHAMDAYLAVRDGVAYPPMLITAGANDPRVISWQPAKFAARLQAASKGGPVLFRTDFDQGHGIGSTRSQLDAAAADIAAFTLWAADPGP